MEQAYATWFISSETSDFKTLTKYGYSAGTGDIKPVKLSRRIRMPSHEGRQPEVDQDCIDTKKIFSCAGII